MPELAEVETFKIQLSKELIGETIIRVKVNHLRSIRRHETPKEFIDLLVNQKIIDITRFGKYLALHLENGLILNAHLRMSGRFLKNASCVDDPKHSHIILETKNNRVVFVDPRTFGEMWITKSVTQETTVGIDALLSDKTELQNILTNLGAVSKRPIKSVLLDQKYISGIGNIYADEICAESKLDINKRICDLTKREIEELVVSIKAVFNKAVKYRGSSLRDESFVDLYGKIGQYQKFHIVHAKKDMLCGNCSGQITKTKIAGRTSYFCENCQT